MTPAEHARDTDGVFVCLGAAVGEKEGIDVAGRDLGEFHTQSRAHFRGHERIRIRQYCGLFLNGAHHSLIAMPDVDAHQLAIEVDEALSFRRPKVNALGARYRDRIDCGLRGPLKERVPAAEFDDLIACHLLAFHCFTCGSHVFLLSPSAYCLLPTAFWPLFFGP